MRWAIDGFSSWPAATEDVADSISFALRWCGRKRVHDSDALTAAIVADRILRHLERSGFVLMKSTVKWIIGHVASGPAVLDGLRNAGLPEE
jgi:hypothetical protein